MSRYTINARLHRSSTGAEITGFSQASLRDMRRRGYSVGDDTGGWTKSSPHDLAKLLLVRALRESGLGLSESWERANDEVVANIVYHALALPGALDTSIASDILSGDPTQIIPWKMEFAASRYGGSHIGGGDYFVFGPTIAAGQYNTIEDAMREASRVHGGPHLVMHVVSLREVSKLLVQRAGELAFIVREDD